MKQNLYKHCLFSVLLLLLLLTCPKAALAQATVAPISAAQSQQAEQTLINLLNQTPPAKLMPPKINDQDIFLTSNFASPASISSSSASGQIPMSDTNPLANLPAAVNENKDNDAASQRCVYQQQEYVLGEMIKTPGGWLRCTPTLMFTAPDFMTAQAGEAAWTKIQ